MAPEKKNTAFIIKVKHCTTNQLIYTDNSEEPVML